MSKNDKGQRNPMRNETTKHETAAEAIAAWTAARKPGTLPGLGLKTRGQTTQIVVRGGTCTGKPRATLKGSWPRAEALAAITAHTATKNGGAA